MGMFDSVYVDASMADQFPFADGTLPSMADEWQTKDLTDGLRKIWLRDNKSYAVFRGESRFWPLSATFTMYCYDRSRGHGLRTEYIVTLKEGVVLDVKPASEAPAGFDEYPFAKEEAESYVRGAENFIANLKKIEAKRTIWQKLGMRVRRVKWAIRMGWQSFRGAL